MTLIVIWLLVIVVCIISVVTNINHKLIVGVGKFRRDQRYLVILGRHNGKIGVLVSSPWIGNIWHLRMELNVLGQDWIHIWRWQVQKIPKTIC